MGFERSPCIPGQYSPGRVGSSSFFCAPAAPAAATDAVCPPPPDDDICNEGGDGNPEPEEATAAAAEKRPASIMDWQSLWLISLLRRFKIVSMPCGLQEPWTDEEKELNMKIGSPIKSSKLSIFSASISTVYSLKRSLYVSQQLCHGMKRPMDWYGKI